MPESQRLSFTPQLVELTRRVPPSQRRVLSRRSQVLPDSQQIAIDRPQVPHRLDNLVPALAKPNHHPRLRNRARVQPLRVLQKLKRHIVVPFGTHPPEHPPHRLDIMVQRVRLRVHHLRQRVRIPLKVRYQHLHLARRQPLPYLPYALREDERTPVRQVVPIHGSNHRVPQPKPLHGLRQSHRLLQVESRRHPRIHRAVRASPRADVPQHHESSRAPVPALPDIRTMRLLADRIQSLRPHNLPQFEIARAPRSLHLQPLR